MNVGYGCVPHTEMGMDLFQKTGLIGRKEKAAVFAPTEWHMRSPMALSLMGYGFYILATTLFVAIHHISFSEHIRKTWTTLNGNKEWLVGRVVRLIASTAMSSHWKTHEF